MIIGWWRKATSNKGKACYIKPSNCPSFIDSSSCPSGHWCSDRKGCHKRGSHPGYTVDTYEHNRRVKQTKVRRHNMKHAYDLASKLCRICSKYGKTVDHVISGCPELAKTEYTHRHDRVGSYIHWKLCMNYKLQTMVHAPTSHCDKK